MRWYRTNLAGYLLVACVSATFWYQTHDWTLTVIATSGWFMAAMNHWFANQIGIKTGLWKTLRDRGEL